MKPLRHRDVIGIFAQHKVAANLLMIIMIIAGLTSLSKLNTQFFPTFALDLITVRVEWRSASAEDVEDSITSRIEQELHRRFCRQNDINIVLWHVDCYFGV